MVRIVVGSSGPSINVHLALGVRVDPLGIVIPAQGSGVDTGDAAASTEPRSQDIADMDLQDLLAAFSDDADDA